MSQLTNQEVVASAFRDPNLLGGKRAKCLDPRWLLHPHTIDQGVGEFLSGPSVDSYRAVARKNSYDHFVDRSWLPKGLGLKER